MFVIGILFKERFMDDLGFLRTPDRPIELLGTHVRYPRSVKTTIGACGPDSLGGSATLQRKSNPLPPPRTCAEPPPRRTSVVPPPRPPWAEGRRRP